MRTEAYERQPAFQGAMKLVALLYPVTGEFPADEKSGLVAAIRRAATALPVKLAEGYSLADPDAAIKAFEAALSLLRELQVTLQIAGMLGMVTRFRLNRLRGKCQRLAAGIDACIDRCDAARADDDCDDDEETLLAEAA